MKTRMTCYDTILFTLLCCNYATRKSLMLLDFSDIAIYKSIVRGIKEKTISESTIRYRRVKGERKHSLTYLTITAAGIKYLIQNCRQHIPWLKYLPNDLTKIRIRGVRCAMSQVERFLRMSIAAQAANAIGAQVQPLYLTERVSKAQTENQEAIDPIEIAEMEESDDAWWLSEDLYAEEVLAATIESGSEAGTEKEEESIVGGDGISDQEPQRLLSEIVTEAIRQAEAENRYQKETSRIIFHSSRQIKASLSSVIKSGNTALASRDLMICRYSGLLESCSNSLLVYVPSATGMDWRERIVRKELATQASFSKLYSTYGAIRYDNQNGVLLVQNEKMLEDIYFDRQGRREEREVLGRSFNKFYVIALEKSWMKDLNRILTSDLAAKRERLLKAAVATGIYEYNDRLSTELFPLKTVGRVPLEDNTTVEDIIVADGTLMDLVQINAIKSLHDHIQDLRCGILCKKYQRTYYERIMPYAYLMFVD